jgi:hypothetical protein
VNHFGTDIDFIERLTRLVEGEIANSKIPQQQSLDSLLAVSAARHEVAKARLVHQTIPSHSGTECHLSVQ